MCLSNYGVMRQIANFIEKNDDKKDRDSAGQVLDDIQGMINQQRRHMAEHDAEDARRERR